MRPHDLAVHIDAVNGKRMALALNAPVIALSGNVIQRSLELTRWSKKQRLDAVLIAGDLVWGTSEPAVLVGAQVMDWPLIGGVITLFWPLDDGVYSAVISDAEGEVSVVGSSEQILPIDQAVELAEHTDDTLVVAGGVATERFRQAGHVISSEHTLSHTLFKSNKRLRAYTRKGMPHLAHVVILVLGVSLGYVGYELHQETQRRQASLREVVMMPPRGNPKLREELLVLGEFRRRIEVLHEYGLKNMLYDPATSKVTLLGQLRAAQRMRLRDLARVLKADLAMLGTDWRMVLQVHILATKSHDLHGLESSLAPILTVLTTKPGWRATVDSYVYGGAPVSLNDGLRLLSRDYKEANVVATVENDMYPLAGLLDAIERTPYGVNGKLGNVLLEFDKGQLIKTQLSFVVRGEGEKAAT